MSLFGFVDGAERGIGGAAMSISQNAAAIRSRMAQAEAADARQEAGHHARRAAGANADFNSVVQMLAAARAENATLRAALEDSDDENATLSEVIGQLRAQLSS